VSWSAAAVPVSLTNATYSIDESYKNAARAGGAERSVLMGDTKVKKCVPTQGKSVSGSASPACAAAGNAVTVGGGVTTFSKIAADVVFPLHPDSSASDPAAAIAAHREKMDRVVRCIRS
jgi:hypothetical protein